MFEPPAHRVQRFLTGLVPVVDDPDVSRNHCFPESSPEQQSASQQKIGLLCERRRIQVCAGRLRLPVSVAVHRELNIVSVIPLITLEDNLLLSISGLPTKGMVSGSRAGPERYAQFSVNGNTVNGAIQSMTACC